MSDTSDNFASRLEVVFGAEGVARLAGSRVVVFGLGGVGSNCVEALARGGVGSLALVDHDVVAASNINRQAIAFVSTIGQVKTEACRAMVADINPSCEVATFAEFVLPDTLDALLDSIGPADFFVDAIDTVSTKLALAAAAQERGLRLISSMGAAGKLDPCCLKFGDLFETTNCRLSRIMRKEARKRGIESLRVLYSSEQVPAADASRPLGSTSYVPPIMGQMIAGEVLQILAGVKG